MNVKKKKKKKKLHDAKEAEGDRTEGKETEARAQSL